VKFRRRKSGKSKSVDDKSEALFQFYSYLRYKAVKPTQEEPPDEQYSEKWGRFPPELRYNFDQVHTSVLYIMFVILETSKS
jgi:hypothetical protein